MNSAYEEELEENIKKLKILNEKVNKTLEDKLEISELKENIELLESEVADFKEKLKQEKKKEKEDKLQKEYIEKNKILVKKRAVMDLANESELELGDEEKLSKLMKNNEISSYLQEEYYELVNENG